MREQGIELKIRGVVQGVGFRPFVFRLAKQFGFYGSVANCGDGVVIRIAPPLFYLDSFLETLQSGPPLSRITSLEKRCVDTFFDTRTFEILASSHDGSSSSLIPPDVSLCDDCLHELFDPEDRRYLYPFINCTNCGPRFSIVESIPYDRLKTSMKVFSMCSDCDHEYYDPADRRFHAQPNCCPVCGPHISWHDSQGREIECDNPVTLAVIALQQGKTVAIRGLGGFHLAVNAESEEAVVKLRQRKQRKAKPLAIMVPDIETARSICLISAKEEEVLLSPERPIVLLEKRSNVLAQSLAPGMNHLGVMLPYTPLHYLLFNVAGAPSALVMTSGNKNGEPICTSNEDAVQKLTTVADNFLFHNRHIVTRVDDSVVRVIHDKMRIMRRARGFVPAAIKVSHDLANVIACGAELKNTFCLTRGKEVFLSQHIGDLKSNENLVFFEESVAHLQNILEVKPVAAVCDQHPDYLSSRYAGETGLPVTIVQHHHAHAVAVMAEHGLNSALAVILDGSGHGSDGTLWGGEFLLADLGSFKRLGCFSRLMLPGGDKAAEQPWRMGISALYESYGADTYHDFLPVSLTEIPREKRQIVTEMLDAGFNSPYTSSCGRLFDAVAALLNLRLESDFEGQAAMELEAQALRAEQDGLRGLVNQCVSFPVEITREHDQLVLQSSAMIRSLITSLSHESDPAQLALAFHQWLITAICQMVGQLAGASGMKKVVLGGGCMQNALLLQGLERGLARDGFEVFSGEMVPVNDGGLSLGQAVVGGLRK